MNNNNNRNNNNRRRGRGNRPATGGQQLNRIDSRARGNAPQLLEKYRKLAQDAHLNGDRVTAEYYLQFADHYFRVIADQRKTQEEQRLRRDDRWEGGNEESAETDDYSDNNDFPSFDQPSYQRAPRQSQEERSRDDRPREERPRRNERPEREEREPRGERADREDEAPTEQPTRYEPAENPFVRDNPAPRGLKPRRAARDPQDNRDRPRRDAPSSRDAGTDETDTAPGIDPSILPPAIVLSPADLLADDLPQAPKRRGRPRKTPEAEGGETLAPADQG